MRELTYVKLEDIKRPKDGRVVVDRWWICHPEKGVVFLPVGKYLIGQCNLDFNSAEKIKETYPARHDLVLIPMAFLGKDHYA